MVHCREDFAGAAALSVVALCLRGTVQAQHVTTWTTRPVSHLQLSRWFFFASPAQVNGHFGFWSILGVLSGIGALIIGITYLICRFKKPTNQVADRDLNMVEDNFVHANVRTVLYPDNHMEHQYLQPAPVVRLESNRPPSYGAATHRPPPSAVATSTVPGASMSTSTPRPATSTSILGNHSRHNRFCLESSVSSGVQETENTLGSQQPGLGTRDTKNTLETQPPRVSVLQTESESESQQIDAEDTKNIYGSQASGFGVRDTKNPHGTQSQSGLYKINGIRPAPIKPPFITSGIACSAGKLTCTSNLLASSPKLTGVAL